MKRKRSTEAQINGALKRPQAAAGISPIRSVWLEDYRFGNRGNP